jgi:signal peptidase I
MILKWLLSSTVRQACAMRKHVEKLLRHQIDILSPEAVAGVEGAIAEVRKGVEQGADKEGLQKLMAALEESANKWLKPYPSANIRENVEVLLVALAVAMAIRTFILQPFKIPTGSMQPTLYGVTSVPDFSQDFARGNPPAPEVSRAAMAKVQPASGMQAVKDWFAGVSFVNLKAKTDGDLEFVGKPFAIAIFNIYQTLRIGGVNHTILFPPDYGGSTLEGRAGLRPGMSFKKGDDVVRMTVKAGDHLFVDRVSYNFRRPTRGDIVVFDTHGISFPDATQLDTFYIKRLVGLGGETLSLSQDYTLSRVPTFGNLDVPVGHLMVDGKPVSVMTPHFENLYSYYGVTKGSKAIPYVENHYYGHGMVRFLAPEQEFHVGPQSYFVMGDNTMNSSDSRYWGDFQQKQVIGKSFFVYWPITERFGWGAR